MYGENRYGRQKEIYQCENCMDFPYDAQCKKTDKNRTIHLNQELTFTHREVVNNLESIQGALLRTNPSIQSEGTFDIMKNNRWYKRSVRNGMRVRN
ncbi:transposase [Pectinatus frisingensis]|uniref:transposase n=2 Tax=Pectinatus frisingensis TaxID=865 RepID=UPI003D8028F3